MRKTAQLILFASLTIIIIVAPLYLTLAKNVDAADGINKQINFQGKVVNSDGTNVADGSYTFLFCIYTTASPSSNCTTGANNDAVWRESKSVQVIGGIFRTALGDTTTLPGSVNFNTDNIYLGINFNADGQMSPLIRFTSVPQAFNAEKVNGLTVTNTSDLPFSSATTLKIADGKTVVINNGLTFSGTDSTTFTFPSTGGNIVTEAFAQTLTNKTIGSTGLTFSGAATDITTAAGEDLTIAPATSGNTIITTTYQSGVRIGSASNTPAVLSVSGGIANNAAFIVNNTNDGDLIAASAAGTTRFKVSNAGNFDLTPTAGTTALTITPGGTSENGIEFFGNTTATGTKIALNDGITEGNFISATVDAITSGNGISFVSNGYGSEFSGKLINLDTYHQVTSVTNESGNSIFVQRRADSNDPSAVYNITGDLATLNSNCTITSGNCVDTSNILQLTQSFGKASGAVLNVVNSGVGSAAAIMSNSGGQAAFIINKTGASGDIFTASSAGVMKFSVGYNGELGLGLTGGVPAYGNSGECLKSGGSGAIATWSSCGAAGGGSNWWQLITASGVLAPGNLTTDLLVGSIATDSAKFSVLGVAAGTNPSASVSATTGGNSGNGVAVFGDGSIQSLRNNNLVIGGNTTGNIVLSPQNNTGLVLMGGSTLVTSKFGFDLSGSSSLANFTLGTTGSLNGKITLNSSGGGISAPTLTTDSSGNLTITTNQASTAVNVGSGNGNITMNLTNVADLFSATKTVSLSSSYSSNDYSFIRVATTNGNTNNGSVLYVANTSNGDTVSDIIRANADLAGGTYAGNLLNLQLADTSVLTVAGTGATAITSSNASAFTVGRQGATSPALQVDSSTGSSATGVKLTAAAAGSGYSFAVVGGNTDENLTIDAKAAGTITLGAASTGDIQFFSSSYKITSGGALTVASCSGCGAGGGGTNYWQINDGVLSPGNGTLDFAIGGTSTASADFIFGTINNGATATATFSGNLVMNSRPNSSQSDIQRWTKISGTAGTIGGGGSNIASLSASTVYNGSLYVGTSTTNGQAEIYRYDGSVLGTWTKVSGTAGTIGDGATTAIASVSAMTVYDGQLYVGTSKINSAELYRYGGGSNWTKINSTAGTFVSTANIDGISSLAVYSGRLMIGTREAGKAEVYRYEGGTSFTAMNTTAGTFVATNTITVDAITSMVTKNGWLYLGLAKAGDADVLRWNGAQGATNAAWQSVNLVSATGSYLINGSASTAFAEVTAMAVYNGSLVVAIRKANGVPEILGLSDGSQTAVGSSPNNWQRLNSAAGTVTTGGTSAILSISSLTVYGGRLYAGTWKAGQAEIYRYETPGTWTKISGPVGQISGTPGSTTGIWGTTILQANNALYAMTSQNTLGAEIYQYDVALDQSYNLTFRATPGLNGGVQNNQQVEGSIFFMASSSAIANNKSAQSGAFAFTHSITTRNGAYDVAEDYPTRDDTLEPGDLISIDTDEREYVKKSEGLTDTGIIGVYSENPALRLSQGEGAFGDAKVIPVALAGRVPLKVSTENGKIKSGDYLTSSSKPGVAMKATKAGVVVGRAMGSYDGDGVGKVAIYVSSNSYNGTTAQLFEDIDTAKDGFEKQVLAKMKGVVSEDGIISEINTDRVFAGLEIVSQKVFATEANISSIFANSASVSGVLTASILKVGKIEGLTSDTISGLIPEIGSFVVQDEFKQSMASVSARLAKLEGLPTLQFASFATGSGEFTQVDNLIITGTATFNEASILNNLTISNNLTFGSNSINTLGTNLELQPFAQGDINIFGGLISMDTKGNITTTGVLSASTVKTDELAITRSGIKFISNTEVEATTGAGLAWITQGETKMKINNIKAHESSIIFISPLVRGIPIYIEDQKEGWFRVGIDTEASEEAKFNFLIVN